MKSFLFFEATLVLGNLALNKCELFLRFVDYMCEGLVLMLELDESLDEELLVPGDFGVGLEVGLVCLILLLMQQSDGFVEFA